MLILKKVTTRNKKMRNGMIGIGLTPIGIFFSLSVIAMVSYYSVPLVLEQRFQKKLDEGYHDISSFLSGVMDTDGYMHKIVDPCSDAITTEKLTAVRLNDCKGYTFFNIIDNNVSDNTNPETSYFKILQNYGDNKVYFAPDATDNTAFYMFLDFNSTYKNDVVERLFGSYIRDNYSDSLRDVEWEAIDVSTGVGGILTDGKVRFRFQK
ncbi:MAG: hypothetical protein RBR02_09305 [Desulfuromonadaceae bacterium]|nr:hypothetical protein [Desulfuromonadaceae bacterium]